MAKDPELVMDPADRGDAHAPRTASSVGPPNAPPVNTPANTLANDTLAQSSPAGINARSEKAPEDAPKHPDGEAKTTSDENDPNARPGSPQADPQNLAKDAAAVRGGLAPEDAVGAASLGQQVGTAVPPGDQAAIERQVESQPDPQGEIRTSWADQGHTNG